jgi:hypothetical protein
VQNANEENKGSSPADPVLVLQAMGRKMRRQWRAHFGGGAARLDRAGGQRAQKAPGLGNSDIERVHGASVIEQSRSGRSKGSPHSLPSIVHFGIDAPSSTKNRDGARDPEMRPRDDSRRPCLFDVHACASARRGSSAVIRVKTPKESTPEKDAADKPCSLCSHLADQEYASQKYGWEERDTHLPAASSSLMVVKDFKPYDSRKLQLWRCPQCGAYYLYKTDYEYLVNGSEDEEYLTRLKEAQAAEYLNRPAPA